MRTIENGRRFALFCGVLLCVVAILYKCLKSDCNPKIKRLPTVSVATVSKTKTATVLKSIGTAASNESADIMSNVTQTVVSIHFSDCERVKKGQLLVQLSVDRKIAEKKQAEINLLEQQRESNRLEGLKNKKIVSEKDYDLQKTKLLDAQAKLDAINVDIKECSVVAPFDGVLGIRKISVGALLTAGSVVTTIDDIDKVKVDFALPEKYATLLKPNLKIVAKSADSKKFYGYVSAIVPRVSPTSRSVSARGIIDNKDHILKPGMMLKISIKLEDREVVRIPEKALSSVGEENYAFALSNENKVSWRPVTVGEREDGFAEIEKGLEVGDKIIVDGAGKLSDGDSVIVEKGEADLISKTPKNND